MRLSISARIFLGYMIVLLTFGGVIGYSFHSSNQMRQDLHLVNKVYLRLALSLAELRTNQGNLLNTITERSQGRGASKFLRSQVREYRRWRLREARRALHIARPSSLSPGPRHVELLARTAERLESIADAFAADEPLFEQLFGETAPGTAASDVAERLLRRETQLYTTILHLRDALEKQVRAAAVQVDVEANRAVWAILALVVIAVVVSLAVTFGAQLTLRPLKTLVAGTQRIGSGDYRHRVEIRARNELGVLGQAFNTMARDIEEREQRLIRSERMAAAGQIASHITHEIRNPLSSISLNTELLDEELEELRGDSDEARKLCLAIRREIDRLTDITEEYLRFARLPKPRLEREDLNEILLNLISFVSADLQEKRVAIVADLDPDLPPVEADENQLRQAFLNLVRNAGEALAGSGGNISIATGIEQQRVVVRVLDDGAGIPKEHLKQIFEPFFSTKETGTGLGLALTQQIIAEHGGTIELDSRSGEGTAFTVRLPISIEREILGAPGAEL